MRSREEIIRESGGMYYEEDTARNTTLLLEVLLDIRDLLEETKNERERKN